MKPSAEEAQGHHMSSPQTSSDLFILGSHVGDDDQGNGSRNLCACCSEKNAFVPQEHFLDRK